MWKYDFDFEIGCVVGQFDFCVVQFVYCFYYVQFEVGVFGCFVFVELVEVFQDFGVFGFWNFWIIVVDVEFQVFIIVCQFDNDFVFDWSVVY